MREASSLFSHFLFILSLSCVNAVKINPPFPQTVTINQPFTATWYRDDLSLPTNWEFVLFEPPKYDREWLVVTDGKNPSGTMVFTVHQTGVVTIEVGGHVQEILSTVTLLAVTPTPTPPTTTKPTPPATQTVTNQGQKANDPPNTTTATVTVVTPGTTPPPTPNTQSDTSSSSSSVSATQSGSSGLPANVHNIVSQTTTTFTTSHSSEFLAVSTSTIVPAGPTGQSPSSSNKGAIIGGIVSGVMVLLLVLILAFCLMRRRHRRRQQDEQRRTRPCSFLATPESNHEAQLSRGLSTRERLKDGQHQSQPALRIFASLNTPQTALAGEPATNWRARPPGTVLSPQGDVGYREKDALSELPSESSTILTTDTDSLRQQLEALRQRIARMEADAEAPPEYQG